MSGRCEGGGEEGAVGGPGSGFSGVPGARVRMTQRREGRGTHEPG